MAVLAGDIAFLGVNSTNPDQFAILALKPIAAGDTFYVTDGGVTGNTGAASSFFRPSEGFLQYTAPTGGIAAGSVLLINAGDSSTTPPTPSSVARNGGGSAGAVTLLANSSNATNNFSFSTSGDSLTAYTVSSGTHFTGTPNLIAFIGFGISPYGTGTAQSSSTPTILGGQVLVLDNLDNAIFTNAANAYLQTINTLSTASNFTARNSTVVDLTTLSSGNISLLPTVNLSVSANTGTEVGTTVITVTATASSAVSGDQTVNLAVTGTGITTGDYTLNNGTITILNGAIAGTVTFAVDDDVLVEGTETAILSISSLSSGLTLGGTTSQNIVITDNDIAANPTVNLSVSANTGTEVGTTVITVTATASSAVSGDQTVNLAVTGTGITTGDYTLNNGTITILNGAIAGTVTFAVDDDVLVEGTETANLTIINQSSGLTLGGTTSQNIVIADNDIAITKISAIQGGGATAALTGIKTIEGIVTRAFLGATKLNGFYVQEEDADTDGNSATSEAIFVYDPSGLFTGNVGDKVRITGTVGEFTTTSGSNISSLTQFSGLTSVVNLGAGTLPTAVNVQLPNSNLEGYEGMLVNLSAGSGSLTVTEYYQLGRYGQVLLSAMGSSNQPGTDARLDQYTQFNAPSVSGYATYLADIAARKIYLDDGSAVQNPDPIIFGRGGNPLSAVNTLRGGDTVASITGILDQRYEGYRIQTTDGVNFTPGGGLGGGLGERPFAPTVGGTLRVASFNVLNYFNDLDTNVNINTNGLSFEPRGANTATELTRQLNKIVQAIISSGADVLGLMELENNGYGANSAIQSLITGLNGVAGAGTYGFISSSTRLGTDAIAVGLIYKSSQVTPFNAAATLPDGFGSGAFDLVGRKPLAQTFRQNSNGELFTAVVNHFKSKGSSSGGVGDADAGDGQGLSNGTRTRQAQDLAAWLATKPTGVDDGDYLLLGDLNAYAQEDPLTTLAVAGYNNLLPNTSYSYVFDGQLGSLDYALATSSLAAQVSGVEIWHINADEPSVLDYNTEFKSVGQVTSLYSPNQFRSSDHDPVIVGLNLGVNSVTTVDLSTYVRVGRYDLPEPTRTTAPANSLLAQEVSAVTYNWDTDTLFVVGDGGTSVVQVSKTGQLINSMTLAPGGSPQGTDFYDVEGLTYVGNGKFVLVEERDRQASLFTYIPGTTLTKANAQVVKLGTTIGNVGMEGISWDPQSGGFIGVKEKELAGIFQTTIDFAAGTASNGSPTTVNSINLFDPALANLLDFADVYALSNLSSLSGKPDYGRLLVLSQESGQVVSIDRSGNISSSLKIFSDPGNPVSVVDQGHEGLTMDKNGYLYVVSENGGGGINYPQLWVYAPSTVPNQAPTALVLDNRVIAIAENTSTIAAIKVADITVTDDGLGTNILSLSGADASFFEINDTALYMKAGTTLDYETKTSYSVTVNVDDATLGNNPDATTNFTLAVTDIINENPTLSALIISEVSPWSSGNSVYTADWFEVTNTGTSAVNITGWKMDDNSNSFASSVALNGVTSIAPGRSVIFMETATPDDTISAFKTAWFGTNVPSGLIIGSYTGSGVGLSTAGDAVNLFNASGTRITGISFGTSTAYTTFDNAVGLGSNTLPLPTVSTLSAVGVKGGFLSFNNALNVTSKETGSPGRIMNMNNLANIGGNGNVTIKEGTNVNAGKLTASGMLTVTDQDAGENKFATTVVSANGNLGSLTITETGAFSYSVDNSAVQYLGAGQSKIDSFTVTSFDGTASQNIAIAINGVTAGFTGVAAGDATANSAILWTRTFDTANTSTQPGVTQDVTLQLSTDAGFTTIVRSISGVTRDANRDYTLKIDATGLQSGTKYYYRFQTTAGELSQVGTFRTAYDATAQAPVKFAFSGDADGVMRPYISTQNFPNLNLDFFEFLGDTIYETASTGSPAATTNIVGNPGQALIDYHRKYLENLQPVNNNGFSGLKGLYGSQGNYTALDNHELGNKQLINGGAPGALATVPGNGSSNTVDDVNATGAFINQNAGFKALIQAYSDYQPIRESVISAPTDPRTNGTQQLYLAQQWGKNVIHINTDTRSYRDVRLKTATGADDTGSRADNSDRTMLGDTQLAWLKQTLLDAQNNGTIWKFVSVSSPIDQIGAIGSGLDSGKSWIGGYRAERNELLKFIADNGIKNVVFLSADDHQNRINEITYTDNGVVKVLPNALSIVGGPIGATGPNTITDHSFANIQSLANNLANSQRAAGVNPVGLDANFPGLRNVVRENDTNPSGIEPVDFYSPDTFNYTVFDVSADGKTLNVNVQGVNSYAVNTFPEPSAANPVRSILSFSIDAAVPMFNFSTANYTVAETSTSGFSNATVRVTREGDVSGTNSVQLQLSGGTAKGSAAAPTVDISQGPSSSATSYIIPSTPGSGVSVKSILTVGDSVNNKPDGTPYRMVGIPDGLGAFDNGDGTFTLLMNHEIGGTSGIVRAHGGTGAFVSKWVINKSDLSVVNGSDLTQTVYVWNGTNFAQSTTTVFSRFCAGDLAAVSAFYNSATGLGSTARIYLNGEESGAEGRAFAHIATGTSAGTTYELPYLGKFSWENTVASPTLSNKTVVAGLDDSGGGQVYFYVGDKTNTGTEIDKAGLNNGKLYGLAVTGLASESDTTNLAQGNRFTLADLGKVENTTGAALQAQSVAAGVTAFLRPEDGHWDPSNLRDFYFVTTGSFSSPSRLWRLRFDDPTNPGLGGTIEAVLDGTEGQKMLDNMTIDKYGNILLQEDVGNNAHIGKIWQYNIATDSLKLLAEHDSNRFLLGSPNFLTQDEESSGIIDAQDILGPGWFLLDTQAHYNITGELVQGGQLQALFNPDTYNAYQTDYVNSAITVTFAPGETYKDVQIPIAGDRVVESGETVNLSLVNPSGGTLGTQQPTAVLTIADNQAPTNLILSTSTVAENQTDGVVGDFTSTDSDAGNTFTYSLVAGGGDTDNDLFSIVDNQLIANTVFDFEGQARYSIRVQTEDQGGLTFERALIINVNDVNEAPTDLFYENNTDTTAIDEGQTDSVVGNLVSTDLDTGNTFTYSLVTGDGDTDNGLFAIVDNQLIALIVFDYESQNSYSIRVQTEDQGGLTFEKVLIINVNDLNEIIGTTGNDNLVGTADNDYVDGDAGNDTLNGGAGNDTYIVDSTLDVVTEAVNGGTDLIQSSVAYTLGNNVENLTLTDTALNGTGNSLNNVITGNGENNSLNGGVGNDTLIGGLGTDTLIGGAGNDTYVVDSTTDAITDSAGTDTIQSSVNLSLVGYATIENLTLTGTALNGTGNSLNNIITGNSGNNTLIGGAGNDSLVGGTGNDAYLFSITTTSLGADTITEAVDGGQDTIDFSGTTAAIRLNLGVTTTQTLVANGSKLTLTAANAIENVIAGAGADRIIGNDLDNRLVGGAGNDALFGGAGNDTLVGGAGNDILTGGAGNDVFGFEGNAAFTVASQGLDAIQDFTPGNDQILLSKSVFASLTSVVGQGFGVAGEFAAVEDDDLAGTSNGLIVYSSSSGSLFYNENGAAAGFGAGGEFAILATAPALTANNFSLV